MIIKYSFIMSLFVSIGLTACDDNTHRLPKSITATNPVDNSNNIELNTNVIASFSEDMLSSTFTESSFTLKTSLNKIIPATVGYNSIKKEALLNPVENLALLGIYTATLTSDIKNLKGKQLTQTSWKFTTRDGTWQNPKQIKHRDGNAGNPRIFFDNNDNAFLTWSEFDRSNPLNNGGTGYKNAWVKHYNHSTGWEEAEIIDSIDYDVSTPEIVFDSTGNALAVWSQNNNHGRDIWSNYYTVNIGWGIAQRIGRENSYYWSSSPEVILDKNGNALAIWDKSFRSNSKIISNSYIVGTGWGIPKNISDTQIDAHSPSIAYDHEGNAIAVWVSNEKIWARHYIASTGWGVLEEVGAATAYTKPQVRFDNNNKSFLVIWSGYKENDTKKKGAAIILKRYSYEIGWGDKQVIASISLGTAPQVALNENGNILVAWEQNSREFWSNYYTAGSGWGKAKKIIKFDVVDSTSSSPNIAIDKNGNAFLVWRRNHEDIWVIRYSMNAGWDIPKKILKSVGEKNFENPSIAVNSKGNAFMAWRNRSDSLKDTIKYMYFK